MSDTPFFLPYQDAWINDDSTFKIAEKSRRVGFTYASSYRIFKKCMKRGKGFQQWVSSRDELTAQEFIRDYIAEWCRKANVVAKGMYGDNIMLFDERKDIKAFVVDFPNGARIISLSSTPEVFAGKGGDIFLDEVDLHKDSGRLIDMATPCITWGGQLEVVSAYRVDGSSSTPFALMVKEAKGANAQGASLHRVTIHDAVAQGIVEKINEKTKKPVTREEFVKKLRAMCRTLAAWQSQYECIQQDAGGKLITLGKITQCEMDPLEIARILSSNLSAPRFGGYDVARKVHAACWHEYALIGVSLFLARREIYRDMRFDDQEKWICSRLEDKSQPRIDRMGIDSTGLGMHMAERLAERYPGRVDPTNLESHRRHELCTLYAERFESMRIIIPADNQLRADLNGPLKSISTNGSLRIIVPQFTDDAGDTSHCDEFMAGVLANGAADAGYSPCQSEVPHKPSSRLYDDYEPRSRRSSHRKVA
jgi:phage FluMu gp28-like protein